MMEQWLWVFLGTAVCQLASTFADGVTGEEDAEKAKEFLAKVTFMKRVSDVWAQWHTVDEPFHHRRCGPEWYIKVDANNGHEGFL